jgi:hypothetical protein
MFCIRLYCREQKFWSLPDYAHVNKVSKNELINQCQLMSYNMMIGYDIYDRFYNGAFSIASKHDFDD